MLVSQSVGRQASGGAAAHGSGTQLLGAARTAPFPSQHTSMQWRATIEEHHTGSVFTWWGVGLALRGSATDQAHNVFKHTHI